MMMIDLQVDCGRLDPLVVSGEIGVVEFPESSEIHIGYKRYGQKPGQFTYEWLVEWLDVSEVANLIEALQFILDHRIEIVSSDECIECQAEGINQ